ncbi:MAG: hypothetical protein WA139_05375 [Candidatus Aenigmatarchaeota archaeon]
MAKEKHHPRNEKHSGEAHHAPAAHHTRKKDAAMQKVIIALALVFLAIAAYGTYLAYSSNAIVSEKLAAAAEAAKPANLQITKILAQGCTDCFDVAQVENAVGQLNVKTSEKTLDYASAEAKELISKYGIKKIPTLIITGETEKAGISFWSQVGTTESDGTLVMRFGAPYVDPSSGMELGKAELVNIADKSCGACYNVSMQENILKSNYGFVFSGIKTYDINSTEGTRLVSQYNITKVPTILISPDAKYYEGLQGIWKQVGTIEADGWYVFRDMQALNGAVYKDLSLNKIINATAQ